MQPNNRLPALFLGFSRLSKALPLVATVVTGSSFDRTSSLLGASNEAGETPTPPDAVAEEAGARGGVVDVDGVL